MTARHLYSFLEVVLFRRNPKISACRKTRDMSDFTRQSLFGLFASRPVEDVLARLHRLDVFLGPFWGYLPIVEIQSSTSSVFELPVEGLAGDFLGARVVISLHGVIWTAIAPPRELTGTLLVALLDNSTDGVWEALMADPVHNDIGDGFSVGIILAFGLPVDGAGKTGDRIVQGLFAGRIDRLRFRLIDDLGLAGSALLPSAEDFSSSTSALSLADSAFCAWSAAVAWPTRKNIARHAAPHICRIVGPPE